MMNSNNDGCYYIDDVRKILNCSETTGYRIIRQLNDELKANGYITIAGRVPKAYFNERCYQGKQ